MPRIVLAVVVLELACSCARLPVKHHHFLVHEEGYPLGNRGGVGSAYLPRPKPLQNFHCQVDETLKAIEGRADGIADGKPLRRLVLVHGGMNSYSADFKRVKQLLGENPRGRPTIRRRPRSTAGGRATPPAPTATTTRSSSSNHRIVA